ncbi:hypothetical protein [Gelidibacter sp.]|uniref:hypothetical protein n=1 Tax=Gelidibacter sp. TaxID=2018083 RepID=UPI0032656E8D
MRHFFIGLCFLGLTSSVFAQDGIVFKETLKKEQVPTVVLEAIDVDFPGYVLREFAASPVEYVEKDVYVNNDVDADIDTYQVSMEGNGKMIIATYNSEGKLLSTVENLKNVTPPLAVQRALLKAYPGWTISKDSYHMSNHSHGKERERYRFVLTKDGQKKHVDTDANGVILKGAHKM